MGDEVHQQPVIRHVVLQIGVWPVGAPQHAVWELFDDRPGKRNHVAVGVLLTSQGLGAGDRQALGATYLAPHIGVFAHELLELDWLLGLFSLDIGIDLGTANTLVCVRNQGIVINEPSVVAIEKKTKKVLAIGAEAKEMVGRTPANIVAVRPLRDGVISDFDVTEQMLHHFIRKVHDRSLLRIPRPRVVVGIPSGVTEVEKRAVHDATISAGAREAYLVEEPMAAAIGAGLKVTEAKGSMIVDIGGGTTEVAVIALGGIVVALSLIPI